MICQTVKPRVSTWKAVTAAADTHLRDQVPKAYKVTAERTLLKRQQAYFTSHVKYAFLNKR